MTEKQQHYDFIELGHQIDGKKMVRHQFVNRHDAAQITQWEQQWDNIDVFASIEQYETPDFESPSICPIFFDIDSLKDLPGTRESVLMLCELLMDRLGLSPDSLNLYFSGNKGFHVVVSCDTFMPAPSPLLLGLYRTMAEKAEGHGIRYIDLGVYTKKRLWRLPNSVNSKSGLYKIPLCLKEIQNMGIQDIMITAQQPHDDERLPLPVPCPSAVAWFQKAMTIYARPQSGPAKSVPVPPGFKRGWRMVPCVRQIEQAVLPDGMRHMTYLALARYYAYLNMHPDEITERIETLDHRNPVRDPDSLWRIMKSGYERPGFPGCDSVLKPYCRREHCFYAKMRK